MLRSASMAWRINRCCNTDHLLVGLPIAFFDLGSSSSSAVWEAEICRCHRISVWSWWDQRSRRHTAESLLPAVVGDAWNCWRKNELIRRGWKIAELHASFGAVMAWVQEPSPPSEMKRRRWPWCSECVDGSLSCNRRGLHFSPCRRSTLVDIRVSLLSVYTHQWLRIAHMQYDCRLLAKCCLNEQG